MDDLSFIVIALAIISFGLFSQRLYRSPVTPPMVFTVFGFLIGPSVFNLAAFDFETEVIHTLAEVTLALVLFTDATRIDVRLLRSEHDIPARMLGVGMPLTIALGALAGAAIMGQLTFWEAAVLAVILAPTDAALGQAVVNSPRMPVRIRQSLNVESGLNDGIGLPLFMILLSVAKAKTHEEPLQYWMYFAAAQVIFGVLAGALTGFGGGKLVERFSEKGWMSHTFQRLSAIALALLAYSLAEEAGGNGFIAAFCAGLTIRIHKHSICHRMQEFGEAEGQLLTLLIFMMFGSAMIPYALDSMGWEVVLYGLLSLTVIRMAPVALSLAGKGLSPQSLLFLGWFGPRGIASILFAIVMLVEARLPGQEVILDAVIFTVLLSIMAHGLTAYPAVEWYARHAGMLHSGASEHVKVTEMPVRVRHHVNEA